MNVPSVPVFFSRFSKSGIQRRNFINNRFAGRNVGLSSNVALDRYIFTLCKYTRCYTWIDSKNRRNLKLHASHSRMPYASSTLEQVDDRFDYAERRVYAIGLVNGLEITVIYADREQGERRIISAGRSEPHERRAHCWNIEELSQ